mmetsp:Transcript_40102/g.99113  ORF Transcript_40102/g.99113 Transcript_40102/m.99113 type:complete len:293 (+) Transcript_40102:403-1281(+)
MSSMTKVLHTYAPLELSAAHQRLTAKEVMMTTGHARSSAVVPFASSVDVPTPVLRAASFARALSASSVGGARILSWCARRRCVKSASALACSGVSLRACSSPITSSCFSPSIATAFEMPTCFVTFALQRSRVGHMFWPKAADVSTGAGRCSVWDERCLALGGGLKERGLSSSSSSLSQHGLGMPSSSLCSLSPPTVGSVKPSAPACLGRPSAPSAPTVGAVEPSTGGGKHACVSAALPFCWARGTGATVCSLSSWSLARLEPAAVDGLALIARPRRCPAPLWRLRAPEGGTR